MQLKADLRVLLKADLHLHLKADLHAVKGKQASLLLCNKINLSISQTIIHINPMFVQPMSIHQHHTQNPPRTQDNEILLPAGIREQSRIEA